MTPFEKGYAGFLAGKTADDNPFNAEACPVSVKRWIEGWNKAYRARQEKNV